MYQIVRAVFVFSLVSQDLDDICYCHLDFCEKKQIRIAQQYASMLLDAISAFNCCWYYELVLYIVLWVGGQGAEGEHGEAYEVKRQVVVEVEVEVEVVVEEPEEDIPV